VLQVAARKPRRKASPKPAGKAPVPAIRPIFTVLIVDDVPDTREMYQAYFKFMGLRVITAEDGAAGIRMARDERPDVIVMDLAMPRMTGWEAIEVLRRDPKFTGIPIIALSGQADCDAALQSGADIYVSKPCMPERLLAEILRALRGPNGPH
jgi:CheY-like chemotaxis protein